MAQSAAVIGLSATGPQDQYLFDETADPWRPNIRQHSHFTKFHRATYPQVTQFVGQTVEFMLMPKEYGDMFTNMYLALTLPQLPQVTGQNYTWCPQIGRAIIEHIEFRIGPNIVEKIDDNWYILRDQLFLDADEKLAMYQATNGGYNETQSCPTTQTVDLMIPLELFFCRRHSFVDRNRERIDVPALPVCALKENISIKFFFRLQSWFTNYPNPIDFTNVRLITEEIILTTEERLYYTSKPLKFIVNTSWSNPNISYTNGVATQYFATNIPVTMMTWFIRNKGYENPTSNSTLRYNFGYYSPYATATGPLVYFNGATVNYIDTIDNCQIYLNGRDMLGAYATGPFFQYKQPMDHELTVPQNSIYTYCFGNTPKFYNQGGYLNFEKLNGQTSKLAIQFKAAYIYQIQSLYTLYIYYYGYQILTIANGFTSLEYKL